MPRCGQASPFPSTSGIGAKNISAGARTRFVRLKKILCWQDSGADVIVCDYE